MTAVIQVREWVSTSLRDRLKIEDEALAEYVGGIAADFEMDLSEKREAIEEFLSSATQEELSDYLAELFEFVSTSQAKHKVEQEEEKTRSSQASKALEKSLLVAEKEVVKEEEPHKEMSNEERRLRQRLLEQYAYDADEVVENEDGEAEILYKDRSDENVASTSGLVVNNNKAIVQQAEIEKRHKAKEESAKRVAREKELKEQERLNREKERQRTAKKERRRG